MLLIGPSCVFVVNVLPVIKTVFINIFRVLLSSRTIMPSVAVGDSQEFHEVSRPVSWTILRARD